jgi:hypothetical protein
MDPVRFGVLTAVGTVGFYAATGGLVYYGRQVSLFAAAVTFVARSPLLAAVGFVALLGSGLLVGRWWSRQGRYG